MSEEIFVECFFLQYMVDLNSQFFIIVCISAAMWSKIKLSFSQSNMVYREWTVSVPGRTAPIIPSSI